jgi:hypothetical protein
MQEEVLLGYTMRIQKDIAGYQYGITQRISNRDMYLGFQLDIMDKTRIS